MNHKNSLKDVRGLCLNMVYAFLIDYKYLYHNTFSYADYIDSLEK